MQKKSLVIIYLVFLFWGIIFCVNDILLPYLKNSFTLTYLKASMIQFTFFGAYLIVSIPAGKVVADVGYKNGIVIGVLISAIGCLFFYPAAQYSIYGIFLFALFVLSSGIALLQAAANPFVAALGPTASSASRLNLALAIEQLGDLASQGSAVLLTAVVGGAIVPPLQGWLADIFNIRVSFIVPCLCYLYVTYYGFWIARKKKALSTI
jgi:FHS family L-fucose permease-like MFS transporter